jgi:predicted transcriptional regulator
MAHQGGDTESAQPAAAVEEARADVRNGDVVPHERVREWLLDRAKVGKTASPRP